jgi:hypothetical protein
MNTQPQLDMMPLSIKIISANTEMQAIVCSFYLSDTEESIKIDFYLLIKIKRN